MTNTSNGAYTSLFISSGGYVLPSAVVTPLEYMGGGFGLVATQNIREDQVTASVPESLILTPSSCLLENNLSPLTPPVVAICLYLMRLRLRCIEHSLKQFLQDSTSNIPSQIYPDECAGLSLAHFACQSPYATTERGRRPLFALWISRLPPQYDNIIGINPNNILNTKYNRTCPQKEKMSDDENELNITADIISHWKTEVLLFRSNLVTYLMPLIGSLRYCRKIAKEIEYWRNLASEYAPAFPKIPPTLARVLNHRRGELPTELGNNLRTRRLLTELFGWAYCSLMSRGFSNDMETWMMIPWVDYFNFNHKRNVRWNFNQYKGCYEFTTLQSVRGGEELVIRYGALSDIELLTWYGFKLCKCSENPILSKNNKNWTHQLMCSYIFSPLANVNGDYDASAEWLENIISASGLHSNYEEIREFCTVGIYTWQRQRASAKSLFDLLGVCSISRESVSVGMHNLVTRLAKWLKQERKLVLLKIILHEIHSLWIETVDTLKEDFWYNSFDKFRTKLLREMGQRAPETQVKERSRYLLSPNIFSVEQACLEIREDIRQLLCEFASQSLHTLEKLLQLHD